LDNQSPLTQLDRQLGLALDSKQGELILDWLKSVTGFNATLPATNDAGEADQGMTMFQFGQRSVCHKIMLIKEHLRNASKDAD